MAAIRQARGPGAASRPALAAALLLLLSAPASGVARAQQEGEEEPISLADDPFEVTDPVAAQVGKAELSLITGYDRARRGRWRGALDGGAEAALGVARGLEVRFGQSAGYGRLDTDRRLDLGAPDESGGGASDRNDRPVWGGATRFGALYEIKPLGGSLPAVSVLQRFRSGYSVGRPGHESETVLLFGQTLGSGRRPLGLSLNLGWVQLLNPAPGERAGRWSVAASVGQALARDTALVLTYVRERQDRGQRDFDLLQLGLRHRLPSGTVLGLAGGIGFGRDSPRFQLGFAAQWQLNLW